MRTIRCLLAAVLAAGIVTVVAAQQPGGFNRGGQDVNTLVFTNAALQEELKVTDAQKTKMKPVADKQAEIAKALRDAFGGGKFDKDKLTELNEKRTKVAEEAKKVADETLTDAQKKRLHQIAIQVMSFNVFNDPEAKGGKGGGGATDAQKSIMKEVGDALKLSDKQKSTVKGVVDDFNKERGDINKEAGITGGFGMKGGKAPDQEKVDAANKKIDKLRKDSWTKIEESLDGTQKTAWKGLVGDAFDTSKLNPPVVKKD